MDVSLFFGLPIDIRRQVYYHLDGNFCKIAPAPVQHLYIDEVIQLSPKTEARSKRQELLFKRYYELFSPYLNIFDYSPSLFDQWLEYSLWLRYDAIVLDCMRINHSYGGSLIGHLDWIYLDDRPRLAYFKNCMLMVWYTLREYARWIIKEEIDDEEADNLNLFGLNLEYLNLDMVKKILNSMKFNDYVMLLSEVFFDQEDEDESDLGEDKMDIDEMSYPMNDLKGIEVIKDLDTMKNLAKISVRGAPLFEALINFHGVRDNPGKTISYMVKKRIMQLELWQISDPSKTGLADFTRWENLRDLRLIKVRSVDLNKFVLPKLCQILILKQVTVMRWWDVESKINELIEGKTTITKLDDFTNERRLDQKTMDPSEIMQCRSIVWQSLKNLNFLKLQNVSEIYGGKIVVPNALYNNRRIQIFPSTSMVNEIIIV